MNAEQAHAPLEAHRHAAVSKGRVLIAEDNFVFRYLVEATLHEEGFEVECSESGSGLLAKLNAIEVREFPDEGVDLIVLDQRMPGLTGLEVLKKLRASNCEIPVILMTAFPDPSMEAEANRLGVPLLAKPFSLDTLKDVVATTIYSRPAFASTWVRP